MILQGGLGDILSLEFSKKEIAGLCDTPAGQIITSDIGADRMDYLLRDSHYTGVAYGVIDSDRICSTLRMRKDGLVLSERGLEAAESLLVARFTMFSTVYLHKTVRIASRMLQEAISLALEDGTLEACNALGMSDAKMLEVLCGSKAGGDFAVRLKLRRLYKKAHSVPIAKMRTKQSEAEELLSDRCGCPVLLDVPKLSAETHVRLERGGGRDVPLSSASELVASLQKMQKSRLDVLVMCEEKNVKKVAAAAERLLR